MDNTNTSKNFFVLDDIRQQDDFCSYFKNILNKENGVQCCLFDDILEFLLKIKEIVDNFLHVCEREVVEKLRSEWLQRQRDMGFKITIDLKWCCMCHTSGCKFKDREKLEDVYIV